MSVLNDYLSACRRRLRRRFIARGAAIMAMSALCVTALFVMIFVTWVPGSGFVLATQVLLYLAIAGGIGTLIWWPMDHDAVTREVEVRVAGFDGRLQTWWDASRRGDDSPMLKLLTRQTQSVAEANHHKTVVTTREFAAPAGTAIVIGLALVMMLVSGNSPWQLAAKRLWTGELFSAAAPRITVAPGDVVVPRGADVIVEATASGFVVRRMEMNAAFEHTNGWERAPMARLGDSKYGFVFVGVSEQVDYYVQAAGLNSERYIIRVADLPRVTGVSLSYQFPDWTGLPVSEHDDGDISALLETRIEITATTDLPVLDPVIVVNGRELAASASGLETHGAFNVSEEGSWHLAVRHQGSLARISDTYLINVVDDALPEVAFSWPGHDAQATAIEEVVLRFLARDDYGVESLELNYSVNGAPWETVALDSDADEAEHLFYLEDLRVTPEPTDTTPAAQRALKAGDMISFFAEAKDHSRQTRTALYFIDVRPFDRTYRESESSGRPGNGSPGFEIADRQREILTATWNLINKQQTDRDADDGEAMRDQANVLALLQRTLKDQVETLTSRAQARRLGRDDEVDTFMTELTAAAVYMEPAAELLDLSDLLAAITPEQRALQHLKAADAAMTDVDVTRSRADMRGTSGRSLSELFDLEMDPERNRYETPQIPNFGEGATEDDGDWRRLEELAARQEQLAQQQRRGEESLASRWQQERLRRELEELQQRLEGRQSNNQNQSALDNAIADLSRARQAIERSLERQQGDARSTRQASRALRQAASQLRENERDNLNQRLARTARHIENLITDQGIVMDRLKEVERESLEASRRGEGNLYQNFAMEAFGERKRRMQKDLDSITHELNEVGDSVGDRDPDTQRVLQLAVSELRDENIDERLANAAIAFELGRPLYATVSEGVVERALQRLAGRVGQARRLLESSGVQPQNDDPLTRVRQLREALSNAAPTRSGGSQSDGDEVNGIFRATEALAFRLGQELGARFDRDTTLSRSSYIPRGTDDDNTATLVSMTRDRLDLIEATLLSLRASPIRAQKPRDLARDSEAAARYFRSLSAPDE